MKINKLKSHSASLGSYDYSQMLLLSLVFEKKKERETKEWKHLVLFHILYLFIVVTLGLLSFIENTAFVFIFSCIHN